MRTCAAALSAHPVAAAALGEVTGEVLEQVGTGADLVVVAAGGAHTASLGAIAEAVGELLAPRCLLAVGASGVLGAGSVARTTPAVALWAGADLGAVAVPPGVLTGEQPLDELPAAGTLVVVAAGPAHLARRLEQLAAERPGLAVVGGVVDPSRQPAGRVGLDGRTDDPVAGVVLSPESATAVSASAVRPLGEPMVVTASTGPVVAELAGSTAADRLDEVVGSLAPADRRALRQGLFLCRVVDERRSEPGPGDVVAHRVRGLVAGTRSLAIDAAVPVGTLVRFGALDAATAEGELTRALSEAAVGGAVAGVLLFSCEGRGTGLLASDTHDATVAAEVAGTPAVAGALCSGEVGRRGSRSWLTGFTASALVVHVGEGPALG